MPSRGGLEEERRGDMLNRLLEEVRQIQMSGGEMLGELRVLNDRVTDLKRDVDGNGGNSMVVRLDRLERDLNRMTEAMDLQAKQRVEDRRLVKTNRLLMFVGLIGAGAAVLASILPLALVRHP